MPSDLPSDLPSATPPDRPTAIAALLREVPLLRGVSTSGLGALADAARPLDLPAGQRLFSAGDEADALHLVLSGRLRVTGQDGEPLRDLTRGAVAGELALLTGARRSATVTAVRDARTLRVGRDAVERLLDAEPGVARALVTRLAEQLATGPGVPPRRRGLGVVVLVICDGGPDLLPALLAQVPTLAVLTPADGDGSAPSADWPADLERAEREHGDVVLSCPPDADPGWRAFCLRAADRVIVTGGREAQPPPAPRPDTVAVLLRPGERWPAWASRLDPVRRARLDGGAASVARLGRRLTGCSPGVVLSGGGARGLAHAGVITALEQAGLRPDRWGGCSMGALLAALAATGRSGPELVAVCRRELVERRPFRDVTLPRQGLLRAGRSRRMLRELFGDLRLEDLADDAFCVTADLGTGELVVHRSGPVAELVGASMAIPGLVPPVLSGGRVLVDGGLVDNLPVDVMLAAEEGPVVAVDVARRSPMTADAVPSLFDTLSQALTLSGRQRLADNLERADAVVTPPLGDLGLTAFDRIDDALAAGRAEVERALPSLAPLWEAGRPLPPRP